MSCVQQLFCLITEDGNQLSSETVSGKVTASTQSLGREGARTVEQIWRKHVSVSRAGNGRMNSVLLPSVTQSRSRGSLALGQCVCVSFPLILFFTSRFHVLSYNTYLLSAQTMLTVRVSVRERRQLSPLTIVLPELPRCAALLASAGLCLSAPPHPCSRLWGQTGALRGLVYLIWLFIIMLSSSGICVKIA